MSAGRQDVLSLTGVVVAVPAALLPWLLSNLVLPMYEAHGAELPALTQFWLRFWPISLLLPLGVGLLCWWLRKHPAQGSITLVASLLGVLLVDGFSVVALWLPLLGLPALAG